MIVEGGLRFSYRKGLKGCWVLPGTFGLSAVNATHLHVRSAELNCARGDTGIYVIASLYSFAMSVKPMCPLNFFNQQCLPLVIQYAQDLVPSSDSETETALSLAQRLLTLVHDGVITAKVSGRRQEAPPRGGLVDGCKPD